MKEWRKNEKGVKESEWVGKEKWERISESEIYTTFMVILPAILGPLTCTT